MDCNIFDLLRDSVDALAARPIRSVLTSAGIALAAAASILVVGVAASSEVEVAEILRAQSEPLLWMEWTSHAQEAGILVEVFDRSFPAVGVVSAAGLARVDNVEVSAHPTLSGATIELDVYGVVGTPVAAAGLGLVSGIPFDEYHMVNASRVALVGGVAAGLLDLSALDGRTAIAIGDRTYLVIGVFDDQTSGGGLNGAILIPHGAARVDFGVDRLRSILVASDSMAGVMGLAERLPARLSPSSPGLLEVSYDFADPTLTSSIIEELERLTAIVLLVGAVVGSLIMASLMTATVIERRPEIGLRRALGATRIEIAGQFMTEGALLGLFAGAIGVTSGVVTLQVLALANDNSLVLPDGLLTFAVLQGLVVGVVASIAPALRAAGQDPVAALSD